MLTVLIKNIKPTEWTMLSTQTKGWVGTGALKYMSAMADSTKPTDKQHRARDSKNNPSGTGPRGVRENIFHLFRSSASGKNNFSHTPGSHCQADRRKQQSKESRASQGTNNQPVLICDTMESVMCAEVLNNPYCRPCNKQVRILKSLINV